jgi:hypothetical protein
MPIRGDRLPGAWVAGLSKARSEQGRTEDEGVERTSADAASKCPGLTVALAGILILAVVLRVWGIGFGLPYVYHVDEPAYVSAALNLGAGIIGRQPNPTGFSNILFGEYATYFALGRLTGQFASTAAFEQSYRMDPSAFNLLGRTTSALLGALTVLVVFWLGREIWSPGAGLLASLFLAVAFLHVRDSHYAVPDVAATFFVALCVFLCVHAVRRQVRWSRWAAAAAGGFALATKWSVLPVLIPLGIVFVCAGFASRQPTARANRFNPAALAIILPLFAGFLAGGFQFLLQPNTFISYALREAHAGEAGGFGLWQIDTVSGWVFYLKTLAYGVGIAMLVLGIMGGLGYLFTTLRQKDRLGALVLAFPLAYYLPMGITRHYFARYALPLIPFMALFAAGAAWAVGRWLGSRYPRLGLMLVAVLVLGCAAQPLSQSIRHDLLLTRVDTRTLAKAWIEANIPAGARIAVDWPVHGPPLSTPDRSMPGSTQVYTVTVVGLTGLAEHSLAWYRQQGFDYLVASSYISSIPLVYEHQDTQRRAFYASLDQELELVQEFRPGKGDNELPFIFDEIYGPAVSLWQRERPGPTLRIYRVRR